MLKLNNSRTDATLLCFYKHMYCLWKQNYTLNLSYKENVWLQRTYKIEMYVEGFGDLEYWDVYMGTK
jgi:hypothetical protein